MDGNGRWPNGVICRAAGHRACVAEHRRVLEDCASTASRPSPSTPFHRELGSPAEEVAVLLGLLGQGCNTDVVLHDKGVRIRT
jgi:undecaprenyl pyrophosphate synthase